MSNQTISNADLLAFLSANPALQQELVDKVVALKEAEIQKKEQYLIDLTKRELNTAIRNSNNLSALVNNLDQHSNNNRLYNTDLVALANAILFVKNKKPAEPVTKVIEVTKEQYYSGQDLSPLVSQQQKPAEPVINCIPGYTMDENYILHILKNSNKGLNIREITKLTPLHMRMDRMHLKKNLVSNLTEKQLMLLHCNNTQTSVRALVKGKLVVKHVLHDGYNCYNYTAA